MDGKPGEVDTSEARGWLDLVSKCQATGTTPGGPDYNQTFAPYETALLIVNSARQEADNAEQSARLKASDGR